MSDAVVSGVTVHAVILPTVATMLPLLMLMLLLVPLFLLPYCLWCCGFCCYCSNSLFFIATAAPSDDDAVTIDIRTLISVAVVYATTICTYIRVAVVVTIPTSLHVDMVAAVRPFTLVIASIILLLVVFFLWMLLIVLSSYVSIVPLAINVPPGVIKTFAFSRVLFTREV